MKTVGHRDDSKLIHIFRILGKESFHLDAVLQRLFGETDFVDAAWVEKNWQTLMG